MKVTFMHLCDYAIVSRDGKLSLLGIRERIHAAVFPWPHPTLFFVFQLQADSTDRGREFAVKVQCIDQDGNHLLEGVLPVQPREGGEPWEFQSHNQVMELHGFPFPRAGTYEFVIGWEGMTVGPDSPARLRFEVAAVKAPDA